jgi:hypothetical protein
VTRALVGAFATAYLLVRFPYFAQLSRNASSGFAPIGVVSILGAPLGTTASVILLVLSIGFGASFTAGHRLRVTGPVFFLLLVWVTTYASSWGKILHSENVLVFHVAILGLAGPTTDRRDAGWALRAASIATVLTYLVAGVTKVRAGGAAWLSGAALGDWLAWDALRKIELGSFHSPLASVVASSPALLQALAIFTLAVELGAPMALLSPRAARAWALVAWLFHVGIVSTMAIAFYYPLTGIAFAPLLSVEKMPLVERLRARVAGRY